MDYQKVIEVINNHERYVGVKYVNGVEEAYVTTYFEKALDTAISAMQEMQMYKQIDQECIQKTGCGLNMLAHKYLEFVDDITELYKYREIGTLEEVRESVHCKKYFDDLYGTGLDVINWHLNGDSEPLDNFIDSARDWSEE